MHEFCHLFMTDAGFFVLDIMAVVFVIGFIVSGIAIHRNNK